MKASVQSPLRMNPDEIVSVLFEGGWPEVPNRPEQRRALSRNDRRKARCFRHSISGRYLYVKVKPGDHSAPRPWPIVIRSEDSDLARSIADQDIVFADFTHGSMYGRFATRRHRGNEEEHYGMQLATESISALRRFLSAYAVAVEGKQ